MATRPKTRRSINWDEMIISLLCTLVGAWVFMLLVGVVHHEWIAALPTIGWWLSLLIVIMVDVVTNCVMYGARVRVID